MAITAPDLVFVASERMIDNLSATAGVGGGGQRGTLVVQDGVSNNVFPDVMPADRITGRLQARLVYPSVLSADNDLLANAHACVLERGTDPLVEVCALLAGGAGANGTRSYDAVASLQAYPGPAWDGTTGTPGTRDASIATRVTVAVEYQPHGLVVGDYVQVALVSGPSVRVEWRKCTAQAAAYFEFSGASPFASGASLKWRKALFGARRVSAAALTDAALSAADTVISVDRVEVRVIPVGASASTPGLVSAEYLPELAGKAPAFVAGGLLLIQHGSTPGTWEVKPVASVNYEAGEVTVATGLANAYPTGSKVTALLPLGDLRAQLNGTPFTQQVWSRTWSDVATGPAISANYSGAIALTNEGAIDDRWAIVFKTSTTFDLLSERFGTLAAGSVGTNFLPLNPMTSEPYFTLFASGWGSGWLPGHVLRFNTRAAAGGLWVARCVSPGAASGTQLAKLAIYGDVDA